MLCHCMFYYYFFFSRAFTGRKARFLPKDWMVGGEEEGREGSGRVGRAAVLI